MAPRDALVRVKLGELYRDLGRPADASQLLREAIELDPAPASYWNSLGMILGGSGDLAGGEQRLSRGGHAAIAATRSTPTTSGWRWPGNASTTRRWRSFAARSSSIPGSLPPVSGSRSCQ